ncbi:hypothetical protein [Methylomonas koyamae]|uniref:hypothetical protein n=1 Tax=Methylomonas koyamae TaxID=702114 RepID=UPI0011282D28|nr:hypothetical protein [Methylomonas koyamae]TPQ27337.1 hypothetical protein C2U68_08620 [Methylomonas koyamae]
MTQYEIVKTIQVDGDFEGFDDEMLFKLVDGSFWIQDEYKYWHHYAYCPRVNVLRANGRFYLQVEGQNQIVAIRQISDVIESQINGEFKGWEGETVYELTNGQVWKQRTYNYEYTYAYMPEVLIYSSGGGYKMQVEGTSADVQQIK